MKNKPFKMEEMIFEEEYGRILGREMEGVGFRKVCDERRMSEGQQYSQKEKKKKKKRRKGKDDRC